MKNTIALALAAALLAGCGGADAPGPADASDPSAGEQAAASDSSPVGETPSEPADAEASESAAENEPDAEAAADDPSSGGGPGDAEPSRDDEDAGGEAGEQADGPAAGDEQDAEPPASGPDSAGQEEAASGAALGGDGEAAANAEPAEAAEDAAPPAESPAEAAAEDGHAEATDAQADPEAAPTTDPPPGFVPGDPTTHPLSVRRMRAQSYPGSDLQVIQELPAGSNYRRAVATYQSEGLTIRGLLTIPNGEPPATGWPVILFNHGYIPPAQYRTTERYVPYQDAFARAGYITYKSDYRGHGSSEGESGSSRGTPDYSVDVLNAMASVARLPEADANRIGMWGHSMGGLITLRNMVVSDRIKAGVIWAGVVASYPDLYNRLGREPRDGTPSATWNGRRSWRLELLDLFGAPEENPAAWDEVSPNAFLSEISGPLQLHHGTADSSVPVIYSQRLQEQMDAAGRPSELFVYPGDDHNLAGNLSTALARSVAFFDQHVKGGG